MMDPMLATMLGMAAVAAACALPGTLLVLRRMAMLSDAISHVLLLGIVLAYFLVGDASSPLLLIGAALSGVATVAFVEALQRTKLVKEDAAIGLVFPAFFSIGVILVTMNLRNVHLDVDRVLLGNAAFISFDLVSLGGMRLPRALVVLSIILLFNAALLMVFFKEIKLAIFDAGLAATLGFLPALVHYGLMLSVSLTTVAAFDAVGSVLVIAFFAVPTATARLLTDRLVWLLVLSLLIAVITAVLGTQLAFTLDTTIAGTVATLLGLVFTTVLVAEPSNGLIAQLVRRMRQRKSFYETMLLVHLLTHEGTPEEVDEANANELPKHLAWTATDVNALAKRAETRGGIIRDNELWKLTEIGRDRARQALHQPTFV